MQGPTAATMRAGSAPSATIAATAESTTPPTAPFHPAWAAQTTRASASASSTGAQSADRAPQTIPGVAVATPSPSGRASPQGRSTVKTTSDWIWKPVSRWSAPAPK